MKQPVAFGKYLLLDRLSIGGMAEVYKAKQAADPGFAKIYALKRILPSMVEDKEFITMFVDEAKITGQLCHPNIAQIIELGRCQDSHFMVMEYVPGRDLLQIQNRFRRLKQKMPSAMAAYCVARMCAGLDHAHKARDANDQPLGIIHRDVSPQNVMVRYDGDVKVIDFGIAKAASRMTKTQAGVLKGKFGYMSPEQVRGLPLDRRSDIFAIATILYELLLADRLFLGESDFATLERVRNVDIARPTEILPHCPPAIEKVILKGLAKDVDDRYQWASEMQRDLETFLGTLRPTFGVTDMAAWMREHFATEIAKEARSLVEQEKLTKEMPAPGKEAFGGFPSLDQAAAGGLVFLDDLDKEVSGGGEPLRGSATEMTPVPFDDLAPASLPVEPAARAGEIAASGRPMRGGDVPSVLPTIMLDTSSDPLPSFESAKPLELGGAFVASPKRPAARSAHPPRQAPRRTAVWIVAGLCVLATIIVSARAFLTKSARTAVGTVIVRAPRGEVFFDGVARGSIENGEPLTLTDVAPGAHHVAVQTPRGSLEQTVSVAAGQASDVEMGGGPSSLAEEARAGPPTERVELVVKSRPEGAEVEVNGKAVGQTPLMVVDLDADKTTQIGVRKSGYAPVSKTVSFATGPHQTLDLTLTPLSSRSAVQRPEPSPFAQYEVGYLIANSTPLGARVWVDNRDTGKTTPVPPKAPIPLSPGRHVVTFVYGGRRFNSEVTIRRGEEVRLIRPLVDQ